jgi:LacI family transcriptional regulator
VAKVTLQDIAIKAGISKVAVFKALNNQKGVSEQLRKKILELADEMGYIRQYKYANQRMNFLFVVDKNFFLTSSEQYYTTIYYYLAAEYQKSFSKVNIVFLDHQPNDYNQIEIAIKTSKEPIDGLFIAGEVHEQLLKDLSIIKLPLVFIDYFSPLYQYSYIHQDNYYLSYRLTKHLMENGHKEIGFVGDIHATSAISDRYFGYRKALADEKIAYTEDWHINRNIEHLNDLINVLPNAVPTAYVCHCDAAAYKLYAALNLKNLKVPQDVSVISFDNTHLCDAVIPTLTSAGCNKETIAKKSISAMQEMIIDSKKILNVTLKPILTVRNSVQSINIKTQSIQ